MADSQQRNGDLTLYHVYNIKELNSAHPVSLEEFWAPDQNAG